MEHELYEKFAELFPEVAECKYSYLRLESDGFEPLSIERLGGGRISVMHTYTLNGDLCYSPMMSFVVDSEKRTMSAAEFEQSIPPLYQRVDKDGSGISVDGNGHQQELKNLRESLNGFAGQWLDNIAEQDFMPVKANLLLEDDEEIQITFDEEGNPIMPEPEPDNTMEQRLYERFSELFPQFMSQEYGLIHLEAEHAKPLALEWTFGDMLTMSHNYMRDGEPAVEPLVMFKVNSEQQTLSAYLLELSDPPRKDYVYSEAGSPNLEMQGSIHDLTAKWLDRIEKQGFMPVRATLWNDGEIDAKDVVVTFDKDGNPITPAPENEETTLDMTLPDPSVGLSEMNLYGYSDEGIMLPLLQGRAIELFDADHPIYLLYPDNTEAMALDRDEILKHDGIFGIECCDWERSPILAAQLAVARTAEGSREADLLYGNENKFGIYQLKHGDEMRDYRFESLERLHGYGLEALRKNYELVYTAPLDIRDTQTNLNKIYNTFNTERPADFTGHSLSVSDIIVLQWRGNISSHYVDSVGFTELPSFLGEESRRTQAAELSEQANSRIGNTPTVAELKADVKEGKVISLTDLSKAVNAERSSHADTQRPKTSLMKRLDMYKQRAAMQGQPDTAKSNNREV